MDNNNSNKNNNEILNSRRIYIYYMNTLRDNLLFRYFIIIISIYKAAGNRWHSCY